MTLLETIFGWGLLMVITITSLTTLSHQHCQGLYEHHKFETLTKAFHHKGRLSKPRKPRVFTRGPFTRSKCQFQGRIIRRGQKLIIQNERGRKSFFAIPSWWRARRSPLKRHLPSVNRNSNSYTFTQEFPFKR